MTATHASTARPIALITGASSGIGATYADRLARRGFDLVLVARRADRLEHLAAQLTQAHGACCEALAADLTDPTALARVEARLAAGDIECFVNNAGIAVSGQVLASDPQALTQQVLLNVLAPTRLARAALPAMKARGHGTLVNMASVVAFMAERGVLGAGYCASKAYVLTLSEGLSAELAGTGVRVQAVLPGVTRTALWDEAGPLLDSLPAAMVMDVGDMVDAALAGLDMGETITVPALPDMADLDALLAARRALHPNLSHRAPASRYGVTPARA